jgi:sugar lactone lactonase YvrE
MGSSMQSLLSNTLVASSRSASHYQNFNANIARSTWLLAILGLLATGSARLCFAQAKLTAQTTLAVTSGTIPETSVTSGTVLTLTATVLASGMPVTRGLVKFCDAAAPYCVDIHIVGSAQLTSAGTAVFKFRPGVGSHSYKAIYVGTNTYATSTSAALQLTVTGPTLSFASTTSIVTNSGNWGSYTLSATVTEIGGTAAPTGNVSFADTSAGNAVLGTANLGAASASLAWPNPQAVTVGVRPVAVVPGDFNNDGIVDLAVSNGLSNTVSILLGKGDGTFGNGPVLTTCQGPGDIAVADFNGDGNLDLAIVCGSGSTLSIYLGHGDGTFTATNSSPIINGGGENIVAGDFNGDGIPDLVVSDLFENSLYILLGKGDGTFTTSTITVPSNFDPDGIAVADFNGDGKLDLAVTSGNLAMAAIFLGNGDGTFNAGASLTTSGNLGLVIAADFNGDGKIDLAVENNSGLNSLFLGNGDGTFTVISAPSIQGGLTSVSDFNRDGIPDIAVMSTENGGGVFVYLGNGDGTFTSTFASVPSFGILSPIGSTAVADFNGDGVPDLATGVFGSSISVMLTMPMETASTAAAPVSLPGSGHHLVDASYAGDSNYGPSVSGTVNLLGTPVASATTLSLTAGGAPATTVSAETPVTLTASVRLGGVPLTAGVVDFCDAAANSCTDIHLIGSAELQSNGTASFKYISGPGSHSYRAVLQQNVTATASSSNTVTLTVNPPAKVLTPTTAAIAQSGAVNNYTLTATVSEVGSSVAATGNVSFHDTSYANSVLATAPLGPAAAGVIFQVGSSFAVSPVGTVQLAAGDFNGDGIPDVAVVSSNTMTATILLGNGDGTFTTKSVLTLSAYTTAVVAGDFNGDGKLDLAVSSVGVTEMGSLTIFLGNGDGTFTAMPGSVPAGSYSSVFAAADLNADGKLDLIVHNLYSSLILLGNGDGTFTQGPVTAFGNVLAVADFNGDGIPDLISGPTTTNIAMVYLGNGDGTFRQGETLGSSSSSFTLGAVGDFNGDGIPDIALAGSAYSAATIFLGKGDGTFTAVTGASNPAVNSPGAIAAADFNGDGKLDLVMTNGNSYSNLQNPDLIVLLGNGDGTFNAVPGDVQLPSTWSLAIADLTGSGTPDVVTGTGRGVSAMLTEPTLTYTATATGVSPNGPAPHIVDASYPGDSNYSGSVSGTTSLNVQVATPVITPASGAYTSQSTITITDATPNATIYYGASGTAVSNNYVQYTGPIPIYANGNTTITAYAMENGYEQSATATASYAFNMRPAPPPVISLASGEYPNTQTVTITDSAPGTTIFYTMNGQIPTYGSTPYTGPVTVSSSGMLSAVATGGGYSPSNLVSAQYLIATSSVPLIYTVAGNRSVGLAGDGGPATVASLNSPFSSAVDSAGNLYIADSVNNLIRKVVAATGIIATYAGTGNYGYTGDGGPAASATLNGPEGLAVDSAGNLYICDTGNNVVRMVAAGTGNISTVAGSSTATVLGDGGPATSAQLLSPTGVAVDHSGNLYISTTIDRIRKVTAATGVINTVAGTGSPGYGGDGGRATSATLYNPLGVAVDAAGDIFIADSGNNVIREVSAAGVITTVAGGAYSFLSHYGGDGGQATSASLSNPYAVAVDSAGSLFIADTGNDAIREVTASNGTINTIAGTPLMCTTLSGDGGPAAEAGICTPTGVTLDYGDNVFITEEGASRVRKVTVPAPPPATAASTPIFSVQQGSYLGPQTVSISDATPGSEIYVTTDGSTPTTVSPGYHGAINVTGTATLEAVAVAPGYLLSTMSAGAYTILTPPETLIYTVAGTGVAGSLGSGSAATSQQLQQPEGVAIDSTGNLYIADFLNGAIWEVTSNGTISMAAGNLFGPSHLAVDHSGDLFVSETSFNQILMISAQTGTTTLFAGGGPAYLAAYGDGGPAVGANLNAPEGIAFDSAGNLYIADQGHNTIRMVAAATGVISTVAGKASGAPLGDGGPATSASLYEPYDVAFDSNNNMYIADTYHGRVRMVAAGTGVITTIAGNGHRGNSGDGGPATSAEVYPLGVKVNSSGNLYVANYPNEVRVVPAGSSLISALAGNGLTGYSGDGGSATMAELCDPNDLALDASGNIYIADQCNNRIRKVMFPGPAATPTFSLAAGTYVNTQTVAITDSTPNATVYYTKDGSTPTPASNLYGGSIAVSASETVRAIAIAAGYITSAVGSAAYVIHAPAAPTITWATPAPIVYGTPLSATQLDASANIAGTFMFSPSAGTILPLGNNTLSVTFTPMDTVNYTTATAHVSITVNSAVPVLSNLSPPITTVGGATFTLTVNGSGFGTGANVYWGSSSLTTQFVNATQVTAQVPASDFASEGIVSVTVRNPGPGGATSNALQFEIDSASGSAPVFSTVTTTVAASSSASYPVTLPTSATNVNVQCLNMPTGATCSYSATNGTVTVSTFSTTPAGTYLITIVFTETLPGAASGLIFLPVLLLPLVAVSRKRVRRQIRLTGLLAITITVVATILGCGGGGNAGNGSAPPQTHTVSSSATVTLVVQ